MPFVGWMTARMIYAEKRELERKPELTEHEQARLEILTEEWKDRSKSDRKDAVNFYRRVTRGKES